MEMELMLRALVAIILSGVLGWEREAAGKSAGVRTHMLVGLGAALFVILGELFVTRFTTARESMRFDPIRIVEAVVTGISFLGAGTIFVSRGDERVKGLTTAASILVTAAVGMMVGLRFYLLATGITLLVFTVLHGLGILKEKLQSRSKKENVIVSPDDHG
jgi:putative Mg2+ transporter-C (MgtC) family protein